MAVDDAPAHSGADLSHLPSRGRAWFSTFVLMLLFAMAYLDRQIISLMVDPISIAFDIGDFEVSLLQGLAFAVLYAICGLPLGMAADRLSRRWIIFGGVLVWSMAAMACGLAQSFNQLFAARILVGAGEAALAPAAYSILADIFPKRRLTFALSVFMLGALLGAEGSLALGGRLLEYAQGGVTVPLLGTLEPWRFAFIATGLPGCAMAFLAFLIQEPARPRPAAGGAGWGEVFAFLQQRKLFFFCQIVGFSLVMALVYARMSWTPTYMMRTFGWGIAQTSYILASFGFVTGVVALLAGGRIVDWLYSRGMHDAHFRYYAGGGLILCLFGASAYWTDDPVAFFVLLVPVVFPLAMGAIGASAIQLTTPGHLRGRVSAVYLLAVSLIGMSAGPAIVGFLTDSVFLDPSAIGMSLSLTFAVVGPLITLVFWSGRRAMQRAVLANA